MDAQQTENLRNEFRIRYWRLSSDILSAVQQHDDVNLLSRLGNELDVFIGLFTQVKILLTHNTQRTDYHL